MKLMNGSSMCLTVSSMASGSGQIRQANTMKKIVSSVCDVVTMMSEITNAAMNKYGVYMRSIVLLRSWIQSCSKISH
ncbi:putative methyl-accepting chemotaxis protein [Yersinia aldovae]|uniref:Putative methyl-accepting chemotaxis protein n=1 Tax=Yersinia aldovae TaxID=29483 RepID=A0A0T9U5J6_YERAL|nr:putative methyl-accepting chemotaxis protein [Yersinia aldovae]CNL20442.1 putative methyl-accepting chemotaxis protein [Yersinia aldovae]